jgi:sugar transferase (PEP-CTERM/EpsH1 system associated)
MKIAYVTSRFPFPVEKGDKLRAYHQIRSLSRKHDVYLFALTHSPVSKEHFNALEQFCAGVSTFLIPQYRMPFNTVISLMNGLPFQVAYFLDFTVKKQFQSELIQLQPDHVIAQLIRTSEYVRNIPFRKTLDYMDAFSFGAKQRRLTGQFLLRPFYQWEEKLLRKYERRVYASFDHHTIISNQDRDRLPLPYQKSVLVTPNGVDTKYFSPYESKSIWTVLFVGNMGYLPNVEAAEFLVKRVMPVVWKQRPEATVCLAGARPNRRVRHLVRHNVHVTGWVDDIRESYAQSEIFVAPMFSGMGLQNKILEAMSMTKPCVTTAIVNNAIGAQPGVHLALGNSAQEIAGQVLKLLHDTKRAHDMGNVARQFVKLDFSWDEQNKMLDSLITEKKECKKEETAV